MTEKTGFKLAIMQPTFNPWLGYFELIDCADKFIFLDTVQLSQQGWQTRNKIKVQDRELLVSVPIQKHKKSKFELLIKDVLIDYRKFDFRKKFLRTLKQSYKKSDYFNEVHEFINELVSYETKFLSEYNINIISRIVRKLEIDTKLITLSGINYQSAHTKGNLVFDICQKYNTNYYISPTGSKGYMKENIDSFIDNKIGVFYQNYKHPIYKQLGKKFIPHLGIFDLLYNNGFTKSLAIIRSGCNYETG